VYTWLFHAFTRHVGTWNRRFMSANNHILTTRMEPWDFVKLLVLCQSVYMRLTLRLSFFLKNSLRGYKVGTTAGFPIKIMEALAPQSRHQIPQKCLQYHMRTCSAHHRVTGSGHPLNGGLGGYYRGKIPRVLQVTGYGPKFWI
jgi:hypothetical protein